MQIFNQKVQKSAAWTLLSISFLMLLLHWFKNNNIDVSLTKIDCSKWVCINELSQKGNQLRIIKEDGSTIMPHYTSKAGVRDSFPVWSGDGSNVYFVSNRDTNFPEIYQWDLKSEAIIRKTFSKTPKNSLEMDRFHPSTLLYASGNKLMSLNTKNTHAECLLPNDATIMNPILQKKLGSSGIKCLKGNFINKSTLLAVYSDTEENLNRLVVHNHNEANQLPIILHESKEIVFSIDEDSGSSCTIASLNMDNTIQIVKLEITEDCWQDKFTPNIELLLSIDFGKEKISLRNLFASIISDKFYIQLAPNTNSWDNYGDIGIEITKTDQGYSWKRIDWNIAPEIHNNINFVTCWAVNSTEDTDKIYLATKESGENSSLFCLQLDDVKKVYESNSPTIITEVALPKKYNF